MVTVLDSYARLGLIDNKGPNPKRSWNHGATSRHHTGRDALDPTRFDALARAFAAGSTRRRLVATFTTLPLVGVLTRIPAKDVEDAQARGRSKGRKHRNRKRQNRNGGNGGGGNNQNQNPNNGNASPPSPLGSTQCGSNGAVCFQDSDCCTKNCFNFQCAARVLQCSQGGTTTNCRPPAKGCAGLQCCYGAVSCNEGCCQAPANQCNPEGNCCAPNCAGKACGDDGCGAGGTCGSCPSGQTCTPDGQCQGSCVPQCRGRQCGPDGCGGSCGTCPTGSTCNDNSGQCLCTPDCTGKQCGPNGCGGSCGTCGTGQTCTAAGQCQNTCSAQTCPNGCCDAAGKCQGGGTAQACGTGGASCEVCPGPCHNCVGGLCSPVPDNFPCGLGVCCGGDCDTQSCGTCGNVCKGGAICMGNTCCTPITGLPGMCSNEVACCAPAVCQNSTCCFPAGGNCNGHNDLCCSGKCGANGRCA